MNIFPRILAVVLHYGDPAMTRVVHEALLRDLRQEEYFSVVVLDNNAPVPYAGALRLEENFFWGGALAYALRLAREKEADYLWFCNNDLRFMTSPPLMARVAGRVARMGKVLGRPLGLWAPAVTASPYLPQMVHDPALQWRSVRCIDGIAPLISLDCVAELAGSNGACGLAGLDTLGFVQNPRGYGLDLWLSLTAYEAGWPVVVDHQVVVRHRYHSTAKKVDGFLEQAARDEHAFMSSRLGPAWRDRVREQASQWEDMTEL